MCGWLEKHSTGLWWNKRYFILNASQKHLEYFKKDKASNRTGMIFLNRYSFEQPLYVLSSA
tara:strand:- start:691 stop:873 length:183 start_codon:yes stop_codon:yes gene_type:complete